MPRLNLKDADEGFTGDQVNSLVEEGIYAADVVSSEFEIDGQGREKVVTTFKVTEEGPAKGLGFRSWHYFHKDECKRISIENLSSIGVPPNWNFKNVGVLKGKPCRINLVQGEGYMNVKGILQRLIPSGEYTCVLENVGLEEASYKKKTPFRRVFFKILEQGECQGLKIMERLFLTEKSLKVTASKLKSFGAELAEFDTDNDRDWGSLTGLKVKIHWLVAPGADGGIYGRVTQYEALGRGTVTTDAPATVAAAAVASATVEVSAEELAGVEDDIPF